MMQALMRLICDQDGQDLIEYALIAGLVSTISALAIASVGTAIKDSYDTSTQTFTAS